MSESIIYCYSGSGHCLDMAKRIAAGLGGTDIVMMRRQPTVLDATGARRVGFVFPCYGGGLPGGVEDSVRMVRIAPDAYKFAVEQYAGYMGCGTCVRVCPRDNVRLVDGRPVLGTDCIGCLGCVQYCPKGALDVGNVTKKRDRYPNRNVGPSELTKAVIHVD